MKFSVELLPAQAEQKLAPADCLLIFSHIDDKGVALSARGQALDAASDGQLQALIDSKQLTGKKSQVDLIPRPFGTTAGMLAILGLGKCDGNNKADLAMAASALYKHLNQRNITHAALNLDNLATISSLDVDVVAKIFTQSLFEAFYQYDQTRSKKSTAPVLAALSFFSDSKDSDSIQRSIQVGHAVGGGMQHTKTLGNLPGNICTPSYLAKEAQRLGKKAGLSTSVLDEAKMKKLGMGSLLSVSKGSREPAKLIVMEYKNGHKDAAPVVLVGKGLTFDAGGISLKPSGDMDEMKYDMCGGATVFGVMHAVTELELPINLIGIVPSSENLPDGAANKPGDIVTSMNGTTIEILNTDAEGRLILCDALTYAERYQPAAVIDIATLTGACMVALGKQTSGLFSNDDQLAAQLQTAGEAVNDRAWRLPIWDEYDPQLKSNFADVANIGGRFAGAITAACFLKRFAENFKWAHLDIAGTAWKSGAQKGATGRPVPLLVEFLMHFKS